MIQLNNMVFRGHHGCLERERRDGNWFRVDLSYDYDIRKAARSDDLADAVDYSRIYALIREEMDIPARLLEHLATRMLERIRSTFPQILQASLTVTKLNPPLDGPVESTSVRVSYE